MKFLFLINFLGSFGKVFLVRDKASQTLHALKVRSFIRMYSTCFVQCSPYILFFLYGNMNFNKFINWLKLKWIRWYSVLPPFYFYLLHSFYRSHYLFHSFHRSHHFISIYFIHFIVLTISLSISFILSFSLSLYLFHSFYRSHYLSLSFSIFHYLPFSHYMYIILSLSHYLSLFLLSSPMCIFFRF